jgi:hypothetical protein
MLIETFVGTGKNHMSCNSSNVSKTNGTETMEILVDTIMVILIRVSLIVDAKILIATLNRNL